MSSPTLEIRDLRAGYGTRVVIDEISLVLESGEWFVLSGPNGCGKSTLLDCVAGRLKPVSGDIMIGGVPLLRNPYGAKLRLGYGCTPDILPGLLTARQCLEIHAGAKGVQLIDGGIFELAEELRFTPHFESFVDTLSLGTRQKLAVLLALVGSPRLIVLDEAFNGLDPASGLILKRHLRERLHSGSTLLLATHGLDVVEQYADRAALLLGGKLIREWRRPEIDELRARGTPFDRVMAEASDSFRA